MRRLKTRKWVVNASIIIIIMDKDIHTQVHNFHKCVFSKPAQNSRLGLVADTLHTLLQLIKYYCMCWKGHSLVHPHSNFISLWFFRFYSAWVTLGKPSSDNPKAYTQSGFQGHLTKVQIWGRALDVTNEIQKQV